MRTGIVFIGGDAPSRAVIDALPDADLVVAADSGYDHAVAAGVDVDVLVGDLDSISQDGRRRATADGIRIERHRPDKDETDTELALRAAMDDGCRRIVGVSAVGDRIDHFLATVRGLRRCRSAGRYERDPLGQFHPYRVRHPGAFGRAAELREALFTVLAQGGFVDGLVIDGARFPLDGVSSPPPRPAASPT
ncbi:MAG: thiamine diphosphokinase [Ilumatobacteraceae bacterium]